MKIWMNSNLVDKRDACVSVYDHGLLYGDGVFEGIRIYGGNIFECQAHMDRLFESARRIRLTIPYSSQQLVEAMEQAIRANGLGEGYIRLVVSRGDGTLGLSPNKCPMPNVIVIADDIELYPRQMYEHGMPVIIAKTLRTSPRMMDPQVKSLNYLNNIMGKIECIDANVAEAIMLNDQGNVAEGTGDNVFIIKDGTLLTPPPSAGILLGVTRGVVMKLARQRGIAVFEKDFDAQKLLAADECFLTGSAAEIIAVSSIDKKPIGNGGVGPVTRTLTEAFKDYIHQACRTTQPAAR